MTKKILFIIIILGFLVRFININHYPPLLWDEASLGYNAYSILKTGRDEYGKFLPLIFKSFGDYKPGLYVYLTVPFVAIFGLNPLAVRLPSVILGSLIPFLLYLLIKKISPKSEKLALIASFLIAFNPWNIHYSRGAWETNILIFELLLGIYLYLDKKIFWSSIIFAATLYTYQGGKIVTPLVIFALLLFFRINLNLKQIIIKFILPLFILSLPLIYGLLFSQNSNRLQVFGLWTYRQNSSDIQQIIKESNNFDYKIFHSPAIFFLRNFLTRYFNYFSTKFLSFEGDWQIGRHSAPYIGVFLYPTVVFFIIGLFSTFIQSLKRADWFFLFLLLTGPLPGALTIDIIQPVRTLFLSIPIIYFASVGIYATINKFRLHLFKVLILSVYFISFVYFSDLYFNHMVLIKSDNWLYGYQSAMTYALNHSQNKTVYFSDHYGQPYIYYLFLTQYDPSKYQSQANLITNGLDTGKVNQIDNFIFQAADFASAKSKPGLLLILTNDDIHGQVIDPKLLTPLTPINDHSSFYAYQTQ
jgi:4-amino-4-deoxy-L-arabinose transferase-like glycosyltransferase